MIYLLDFSYRIFYAFFSCILGIIYLYFFLDDFIFIFTLPSIIQTNIIDSFIFTEPKEIFIFKILICIFYLFLTCIPYFVILFFDYFKAGLYNNEWLHIKKLQIFFLIFYYICNFLSFFIFLPIFWSFFLSLATHHSLTNYFFELSALNYFNFLFSTHISLLLACLFLILFSYLSYFFGIKLLLTIKRYIIILILLFSTIITPPDLEFQICLFLSLYICLESFFAFLFLKYYYLKFLIKKVTN